MTMIVVTHEMGFAREVGRPRRLHGRAAWSSSRESPREVINNPQHERTKSFLSRIREENEDYAAALVERAEAEKL